MSFDREWEGVGPVVATELQIVDSSGNVVIDASPTPNPSIIVTGTGAIAIFDPVTNKELDLVVLGGTGSTPEIILSGHGTFGTGSMSAVIQMDDLADQIFRIFMGRRGQDDSRAAINQWDIAATRNTFRMHGYDVDFATSTLGWIFDGTAPGGLHALIGDTEETWHTPALLNGWSQLPGYIGIAYRIDIENHVEFKGTIHNGVVADNTQIMTLPVGYRPLANALLRPPVGPSGSGNVGSSRVFITAAGGVFIYGMTGVTDIGFDNLKFSLEA